MFTPHDGLSDATLAFIGMDLAETGPVSPRDAGASCCCAGSVPGWQQELDELVLDKDRLEWAHSQKLDVGALPPWPEDPFAEAKDARATALKLAVAAADEYGTDERVLDLICDETDLELRMALWRADRIDDINARVLRYFELYNNGWYHEAVEMATRLLEEHDKYNIKFSDDLLRTLQASSLISDNNCGDGWPSVGEVSGFE
jgi:hypothetical protein